MCRVVAAVGITTQSYTTLHCTTLHYTDLHCPSSSTSQHQWQRWGSTILHYLLSTVHQLQWLNYAVEQSYTIQYPTQLHICSLHSAMPQNNPTISYSTQLLTLSPQSLHNPTIVLQYTTILHNYCSTTLNIQYFCQHQSVAHNCTQLRFPSPDSTILHSQKQSFAPECYPPSTILHSHNNPIMLPPPSWPCHQHKYNANLHMIMLPPTIIALC